MTGEVWIGLLGVLVAVAVPIIAHRATHPKREISFYTTAEPAWRDDHDRRPATKVVLQVWCTGRADVPSDRFDGGLPLTFRFESEVLGVSSPSNDPDSWRFRQDGLHNVMLGPVVVGRGTLFTAIVTVEGEPRMRVLSPLVDTDVVVSRTPPTDVTGKPRARTTLGIFGIGVILTLLGLFLFGVYYVLYTIAFNDLFTADSIDESSFELLDTARVFAFLGAALILSGLGTMLVAGVVLISKSIGSRRNKRDRT